MGAPDSRAVPTSDNFAGTDIEAADKASLDTPAFGDIPSDRAVDSVEVDIADTLEGMLLEDTVAVVGMPVADIQGGQGIADIPAAGKHRGRLPVGQHIVPVVLQRSVQPVVLESGFASLGDLQRAGDW